MDTVRAYGAGMAGVGGFNWITFIRKPTVIFRIITSVVSIIILFSISGSWFRNKENVEICLFGGGSGSCGLGNAIAFISLANAIIFLLVDGMFDQISSVKQRKQTVIGDLGSSAFWTFFYFILFVTLWAKYNSLELNESYDGGPPGAAIFFSFFNIFAWGGIAFFAWHRYQEGAATAFAPSYEQEFGGNMGGDYGYAGGPSVGGAESYQEPPFTAKNESSNIPQYQQPPY